MKQCAARVAALSALLAVFLMTGLPAQAQTVEKKVEPRPAVAEGTLRQRVPGLKIEYDGAFGLPKNICSSVGFLTGANGSGGAVSSGVSPLDPTSIFLHVCRSPEPSRQGRPHLCCTRAYFRPEFC